MVYTPTHVYLHALLLGIPPSSAASTVSRHFGTETKHNRDLIFGDIIPTMSFVERLSFIQSDCSPVSSPVVQSIDPVALWYKKWIYQENHINSCFPNYTSIFFWETINLTAAVPLGNHSCRIMANGHLAASFWQISWWETNSGLIKGQNAKTTEHVQ